MKINLSEMKVRIKCIDCGEAHVFEDETVAVNFMDAREWVTLSDGDRCKLCSIIVSHNGRCRAFKGCI
jgi:hypothetical protein